MAENTGEQKSENQIRQEEEQEALNALYGEQVTYIISTCWNVWCPTDCLLRLRPHDSCFLNGDPQGKSNLSVVLSVKCSPEYPNRKPLIQLLEPRGLSQEAVKNLLNILRKIADDNEGETMISALGERVTDFLTDYEPHPAGSFHDDMLANRAKKEDEKKRKRLDTEQKEMESLEEEMRQRNAIELEKTLNGTRSEGETRIIGGRRIVVLTNIPVKRQKPCNSCHEWMGFWENMQLLISEWTFRYTGGRNPGDGKNKDFTPFLAKFDSVCNDIQKLCEIKGLDQNLVEYAFVHQQKITISSESVLVQLFVAQKIFSYEENMQDTYELIVPKSNLLRLLAVQAICGLRYLHESSMTHKHLSIGSVWTRNSTGDCVFRFSDFGSMGPLLDLVKLFTEICSGKYVPQDEDKEKENDRRRKDLFQLGTLLDGLVLSFQTRDSNYSRVPTPIPSVQNSGSTLLSKFIAKCQEAKNIDQLVEDPFLKEESKSESENIFTPFGGAMSPDGRMLCDNVIIRVLGRGGFGDVVLVRNKMDSTDYAIKRIPLNANSEKLNRKIAKEAKFFAKLNHPNMVRYYNAWAEELIPIHEDSSDDDSSLGAVPIPGKEKVGKKQKCPTGKSPVDKKDDLGGGDSLMPFNLRGLAKELSKGAEAKEWSTNYFGNLEGQKCPSRMRQSKRSTPSGGLKHLSECATDDEDEEEISSEIDWDAESEIEEESDDSEDSDEEEGDEVESNELQTRRSEGTDSVFGRSSTSKSVEDEDIVFLAESEGLKAKKEESQELMGDVATSRSKEIEQMSARKPRILCIQMEYCDRATLRQHIDDNHCFNSPNEVWRIFFEVLCGLKYMHDMAMIHRDIKPLNIFLTSQNGVKIGDFGLATLEAMNSKGRIAPSGAEKSNSIEAVLSPNGGKSKGLEQTRDIGTQLYMAPELFVEEIVPKTPYTSKIDIYSAGVVLFEMFYRPLPPSMDRVSSLNNLRNEIKIPTDFGSGLSTAMCALARKTVERMLQKNADKRPTADDLLNDEDLPMHTKEDATFRNLCEKVVKKRESRMNAWLLDQQFKEDVPTAVNYCYDVNICQDRLKYNHREAHVETLRSQFCKVFKVHAFERVHTHTLIPVSTALAAASVRTKPTEYLDRNGLPVALPMDLRQNFVRFCVRNSIQRMKRFNFGRVYSQNLPNVHPHEKWECSVDSIGPQSSSTTLEAELLLVACEIIAVSLPGMKLSLKIGHCLLLEAQIRHLKLSDDVRTELLDSLHIISVSDRTLSHKEKVDMLSPKIGAKAANIITKLMIPVENNFASFKEKVMSFRKKLKVNAIRDLLDKVISDLDEIMKTFKLCRNEDIEKISIVYDAQTCYRPRTFGDGLVFQLQVEKTNNIANKKGRSHTVLAGGRYDSALLRERHPRDFVYDNPLCISGFGVAMDMVAQIRESNTKSVTNVKTSADHCKVLICSMVQPNGSNLINEKFKLAKEFWNMGIEADVFHSAIDDLDSLNEHQTRASISHILAVCNSNLEILCKTETSTEMIDFDSVISTLCRETQSINNQQVMMTPNGGPIASASTPGDSNYHEDHYGSSGTPLVASKSASSSTITSLRTSCATLANVNVCFATASDKYHKNIKEKKRVENQVRNHLTEFVTQFSNKSKVEVLVCDVPSEVIKKIVGDISKLSTDEEINALFDQLIQKHGKVDLAPLRKQLHSILHGSPAGFGTGAVIIVFYRHVDNFYRCLT